MTSAALGNGLALEQGWSGGRLASKRLFNAATGANLSSLGYAYDDDDNIVAINDNVDASRTVQYSYDNRDRLTRLVAASGSIRRQDYLFDQNGNRTGVEYRAEAGDASPQSSDSYARNSGTNRLASITAAAGTRTIAYDGRGNMLSETRPGGATVSAAYDGHGRLLSYERSGDPAQANGYNGLDERVSVNSGGTTRAYVHDPDGRLIGEYGASAADVVAETIWLQPDRARRRGQPLAPCGGEPAAVCGPGWAQSAGSRWGNCNRRRWGWGCGCGIARSGRSAALESAPVPGQRVPLASCIAGDLSSRSGAGSGRDVD